jgi:hypothetical protein
MTRLLTRLVTRVSKPGLSGIGVQRTSLRVSLLVVCIFPTLVFGKTTYGSVEWETGALPAVGATAFQLQLRTS